ncbi:lysine N(6)-hydroxylase/L-ornithine N(5)-oxygenase family protein [Psychrobacter phenylpyruvicus]|uniref:L-lysine 6-monooxygenase n=1 Tax=Psychrobacter phenylpyruvicus TaxID=29432 RepID=A0A379LM05_9GAMM|nr:SidA/IucD/PvdA family monooxygenase [Psychrobacter phenylpyruvicus]SUD90812.1 L-lysine 6-monooxygenase [Psychrobacter phenylpyruvicus]
MLDLIGIGIGPFNLCLAALIDKQPTLSSKFFEKKPNFDWHKGMILPHTTLQVPFMADLVTLIDPTSRYSFLNYLHHHHRLLKFYFLEDFKIFRQEYNDYCQWVAGQLDSLVFDTEVVDVALMEEQAGYVVRVNEQGEIKTYHAKNIVIGTGTQPTLPAVLQSLADKAPHRCMHTADFANLFNYEQIKQSDTPPKVLVLGSGQSSAEVYRALFDQQLDPYGQPKFQLDWFTRSAGFFPMEYSPLGLEHFSPAYTDYFYHLPDSTKYSLLKKQDLLYKGMGFSTIRDIYSRLYERSIANQPTHSNLLAHCEVIDAKAVNDDSDKNNHDLKLQLTVKQREQQRQFTAQYDCVIAGTGYRHGLPRCFDSLLPYIEHNEFDQPKINLNYTLEFKDDRVPKLQRQTPQDAHKNRVVGQVFVQNQEIHSHGVGAPDLGLGAYRAGYIINQLQGEQVYDTKALSVFQDFGISDCRPSLSD